MKNDEKIDAADFDIENLNDDLADASVEVVELTTEISDVIPATFTLEQNYPNPFNPTTKITYGIPAIQGKSVAVKLSIYNVSGQIVRILVDEEKSAGRYSEMFDASALTSGIYFYRFQTGEFIKTNKMILGKLRRELPSSLERNDNI